LIEIFLPVMILLGDNYILWYWAISRLLFIVVKGMIMFSVMAAGWAFMG